jgi:hypothetical protein
VLSFWCVALCSLQHLLALQKGQERSPPLVAANQRPFRCPPRNRPKLPCVATTRCLQSAWLVTCRGLSATSNLGASVRIGSRPLENGDSPCRAPAIEWRLSHAYANLHEYLPLWSSFVCRGPAPLQRCTEHHTRPPPGVLPTNPTPALSCSRININSPSPSAGARHESSLLLVVPHCTTYYPSAAQLAAVRHNNHACRRQRRSRKYSLLPLPVLHG